MNTFNISGYCTEFNEVGGIIQNHYPAPCKRVFPKCNKAYYSSDAYKCKYAHSKVL